MKLTRLNRKNSVGTVTDICSIIDTNQESVVLQQHPTGAFGRPFFFARFLLWERTLVAHRVGSYRRRPLLLVGAHPVRDSALTINAKSGQPHRAPTGGDRKSVV